MKKPNVILNKFDKYTPIVDAEMEKLISNYDKHEMYRMMEYFLGFKDQNFKKLKTYSGKRFRPGICMLLSDYYGNMKDAIPVAAAIELFHNFTLIHDDIQDNDSLRRGKPTVWKLWGINHGINTGDAQFALSYIELLKYSEKNPTNGIRIQKLLYENYMRVTEGQYMDLELANLSISNGYVNIKNYLEMITSKTAVLVATSATAAGLINKKKEKECRALWEYGLNLGLAFQFADDLISIWGKAEETGKVEAKDLVERKKTLPIIYLFNKLSEKNKKKFARIYDKEGVLTADEVSEIKIMLSEDKAHDYVWGKMKEKITLSNRAIEKLSLTSEQKNTLLEINKVLIPNMKWWDA